jgi:ribose transport system substrate-binding protein
MAHILTRAVIVGFGMLSCCGCRRDRSHTIAVIPETTGTRLWESVHVGAELAGNQEGYKIYWNAPTREDDIEGQIALVERAIQDRDGGIVLAPDHSLALLTVVHEAQANHIPVAIIHSPLAIPAGDNLTYVINDDEAMGRLAADRLGNVLYGKGTIAMIGIDPNANGVLLRSQAFEVSLKSKYPNIAVVERRSGSSNTVEIQSVAAEVLEDHPNLDGIVAFSAIASEGSWAAINSLKKNGQVRLVGCDQETDLMAGIRHGDIDSILVEDPYDMGRLAVKWISDQKKGSAKHQFLRLPPLLVTKANIDDPSVQKALSNNWRVQR